MVPIRLLVLDIDNTLFDWVSYYVPAFKAQLLRLEEIIGVTYAQLAAESRQVFRQYGSIEYPFLVQELPSVIAYYGERVDAMLSEAVAPCRAAFMAVAAQALKPYEGVAETLARLQAEVPHLAIVALTDAPRYVAMWKLNKLKLLSYFTAVYGLADPRLPTCANKIKVSEDILLKFIRQHSFGYKGIIRILPDEYEKPGVRGLKTVLMDFELDEPVTSREAVLWVGDNLRKDIGLGNKLGITTAWARYGTHVQVGTLEDLALISPPENTEKNLNLVRPDAAAIRPDLELERFDGVLKFFNF